MGYEGWVGVCIGFSFAFPPALLLPANEAGGHLAPETPSQKGSNVYPVLKVA